VSNRSGSHAPLSASPVGAGCRPRVQAPPASPASSRRSSPRSRIAATGVFAVVTLQRTLRAESPLVEKELFRSRQFTAATIALLYFTGFSAFLLGGALFMQ
jgi:hypothetical protein